MSPKPTLSIYQLVWKLNNCCCCCQLTKYLLGDGDGGMGKRAKGVVINVGSAASLTPMPLWTAYSAAKADRHTHLPPPIP